MRTPFLTLLFLFIAFGIGAQSSSKEREPANVAVVALHFKKDETGTSVSIQSAALIKTGKPVDDLDIRKEGDKLLHCDILDEKFQLIRSLSIKDPFVRMYEHPEEGNTFGKMHQDVSENDIIIRFPFNQEMHYLEFFEKNTEGRRDFLSRIEMPELNHE